MGVVQKRKTLGRRLRRGGGGGASYILLEKGTDQEVNSSLTPAMLAWR